jgi:hypothetical protein
MPYTTKCKGIEMTYTQKVIKREVTLTMFKFGVSSALEVENVTPEQRIAWITEELAKLEEKLNIITKDYHTNDEIGDPFVGIEAK